MRSEDNLVGVRVPESAHATLGRRLCECLEVAEQQPVGRLRFAQNVGAKLVSLRVVTRTHLLGPVLHALQRRLLARRQTESIRNGHPSAPAKINLTLEVLARRDDGYHGVRSVMVPLDLSDELAIEPSRRFAFECDDPALDAERNLAVKALRALGDLPSVRMQLHKRIPVQAGLGGGSSDAAAVLRAAMLGEFGSQPPRDWLRIARTLGSDVPFFLAGTAALVEGTGERVTPAGALPHWHALIVKPPVAISTAAAYDALDRLERPQRPRGGSISIAALEALQRSDFERIESLLQNDFHEVVASAYPEVACALEALARRRRRECASGRFGFVRLHDFTRARSDRADPRTARVARIVRTLR